MLIKSLKYFRVFILHSHEVAYIPDVAIKTILIQLESDGRRHKWITKIIEFNLEINPIKLIKGHGLAKLMTETNLETFGVNMIM